MQITDVKDASREAVNHPSHYAAHYKREVIELTARFDFTTGNAIKYVLRCRYKALPAEDLQKARWYLNYFIDHPDVGFCDEEAAKPALADFLEDLLRKDDEFGRDAARFLESLAQAVAEKDFSARKPFTDRSAAALDALIARAAKKL